ncbi:MAG: hypothetical protein R2860_10380 [Desulfobacterales bacterium]
MVFSAGEEGPEVEVPYDRVVKYWAETRLCSGRIFTITGARFRWTPRKFCDHS